ncbi:ADP-ribosylation factor-like protein 6-interacting protein 1 [Sitodiplosis mosellana]|uniref:ADP-ribosylation factor-like protein 6-interacting protein 1 n=1 Tax=Sitodiplosis mosellana TaxID=263140 RepID=UPI00244433AC|nr:ADP-ribosylation factor-like protein 6-interacting protein 1 [Sitodiplosis mosellana]
MADANSEQAKEFNKLKHDLEDHRELILLLSSVLKWEKKFYPGVIFGAISFLFLILWFLNLSLLTLVGVIGVVAVLIDYGYPMVSKIIFKPENWTGAQEKAYEEVVNEILAIKLKVCGFTKYACVPKEEKTIVYYLGAAGGFIALAYVGSVIDNFLLSYLAILSVALFPGLCRHGVGKIVIEKLLDQVKQIKEKTIKKN